MTDPLDVLGAKGFDVIETDLPGAWSTDGEWTVAVLTRPIHGGPIGDRCHRVLVYANPPRRIGTEAELAGEATAVSTETAVRKALSAAGYPVEKGR